MLKTEEQIIKEAEWIADTLEADDKAMAASDTIRYLINITKIYSYSLTDAIDVLLKEKRKNKKLKRQLLFMCKRLSETKQKSGDAK